MGYRCDTCGKFRPQSDLRRRPVTQADYLFGDPGPFYDCAECRGEEENRG